ncbi:thioesterase [Alkalicaulis satelles]|uniref:Thioesterase n=1 Tax=Alkalicaulis satelles TaxID=2609175 RepID=A0A5M6ZJE4_9PROT|nr:thioesterase family protein [Alkalicaulis satelles]KAA5803368.1 thioesterase [Alkalicaulis satelles]
MLTLWRGNANAWECDELGHLNVRFYLAKAWEAIEALACEAGMRAPFQPGATATLIAREVIVRFLAEARPGAPLVIRGSVRQVDEAGLTADLIMDHAALGKPAAAFSVHLDHVDPASARPFAWSGRVRARLDALTGAAPPECAPRSLSQAPPAADVSLGRADALGLEEIGRGRINPQDADRFGRMRLEFAMGKVSDSVIHLSAGFPEQWRAYQAGQAPGAASALLEARIVMRRWPQAGEGFVIRSGLAGAGGKVRHLVHWVCDPVSGAPLWTMQGVGCLLDLDTRRLKPVEGQALKTMQAAVIDGLAL